MNVYDVKIHELESYGDFISRHIGSSEDQINGMLNYLVLDALDEIIAKVFPEDIVDDQALNFPETKSERTVSGYLNNLGLRNKVFTSLIGMGYYGTILPDVIKRNVLENPGWYTAYTPYQSEISQGRLEALLNFQQMIIDLTAMEIANASLLDEATAAAEAMAMSKRLSKKTSYIYCVDKDCHPQTIAVMKTRAESLGFDLYVIDIERELDKYNHFGVLFQYPGTRGEIKDLRNFIPYCQSHQSMTTVATDLLSLVVLTPPGEQDADIVVGSSQRFGVPIAYGGPHAAFFATRKQFTRSMPGRIIGVSQDQFGAPALRMALQTREQHIRREKATSNICPSQALLAIISGFYAIYHGRKGLELIAARVHRLTLILAKGLRKLDYKISHKIFFDTLTIEVPGKARRICARAREAKFNFRLIDKNTIGISLDETTNPNDIITIWKIFDFSAEEKINFENIDNQIKENIPENLRRGSVFLTHPVFNDYHSETEMMRYMRRLARRDIALDRSMIPLGSCTMKLNAAVEMQALSNDRFNSLHPFIPLDQAQGYMQLFEELENMLCDLTGFNAFSLQPNAGSQGEYAGLLVIKKYHENRGQAQRNICLIPASAHGTNPASAQMAGMKVKVIKCDTKGNIDVQDMKNKSTEFSNQLAGLMITYPSTHGVFEESFSEVCEIIHTHGGQVYFDGANFNALVGLCRPGLIGADVAHLNLHKTFSIPHGGGGPGVGPIGVKEHLAQYLPDHPVVDGVNPDATDSSAIGAISAAPWGSASILTISWAFINLMCEKGLRRSTLVAILNANYIRQRLQEYYPILYTGKNGMVAHECIIDIRAIKSSSGISADDIAKRLIDYGFHAPTMSFPVPDTFMIEPTESENKRELDRFCDAMIHIRQEIKDIEEGIIEKEKSPLRYAPHSHGDLLRKDWNRPYSMQTAFFPMAKIKDDKFWPPVGRIDNQYGDKNLFCSCIIPDDLIMGLNS